MDERVRGNNNRPLRIALKPAELHRVDLALARGSSRAAAPGQPGSRPPRVAGHLRIRDPQRALELSTPFSAHRTITGKRSAPPSAWAATPIPWRPWPAPSAAPGSGSGRFREHLLGRLTDQGDWGADELAGPGCEAIALSRSADADRRQRVILARAIPSNPPRHPAVEAPMPHGKIYQDVTETVGQYAPDPTQPAGRRPARARIAVKHEGYNPVQFGEGPHRRRHDQRRGRAGPAASRA